MGFPLSLLRFMIEREGNVFGYVSGALNEDMMKNIIEQTLEGKRK